MRRPISLIWTAALVALLIACQPTPVAQPTATPLPTSTATAVPPTATPIPPTATPMPPTATPVPPTPTETPIPPTPTAAAPVLEIVGPEGSQAFSMADLQAMPTIEGYGGIKSSTGKITLPEMFKGVGLKDLAASAGTLDENMGINVMAEDGYGITFSYDQVMNGTFVAYDPATGDELKTHDPLTAIIAYEQNDQPLNAKQDGTLRVAIVSAKNNQVVDGHWAVKWVTTIELKDLGREWTLHLEGALTEDMDRGTFESGASPNCHGAIWQDDHAQDWVGIPLWLLVGRVDDDIKHNGPAFNEAAADAGYTVDVIAADGYTVTFDSARIRRNDNIIVAYSVNDNPLPDQYFPLRLVGSDLQKNEMVGMIAQIVVHLSAETLAATPTPTPEPTPTAAAAAAVEGDLVIVGMVDTPLGLSDADLHAMDVVQITAEHPKQGQQEYEGVRLNALLDQAGVQAGAKKLVLTAVDGYTVEVFLAEVRECPDCLVGFTGTPGDYKMAMPGLPSSVWARDVVKIDVQ